MSESTRRRSSNCVSGCEVDYSTVPKGGRESYPRIASLYANVGATNRPRCGHYISTRSSSEEKESLVAARSRRCAQSRAVQPAFRERNKRHVTDLEAQLDTFGHQSISFKGENERRETELPKIAEGSSARTQASVRKPASCAKSHHVRDSSETAWDVLHRILRQHRLDDIALILRTIQILAAACRSMTFSELNIACETIFRLLRDRRGEAQLNVETQNRIARREVDYVRLCGELLNVNSSGNVEFCHKDMQQAFSSLEFRQQFGLQNGGEVLTAICIQHLGCGEQTQALAPTRAGNCLVPGQVTCTFRAYATGFWKKHYLETNGGSQWIHSLLHDALVSSVAKGVFPDMQCQRRCNRVLATGLEMAASQDLHVIGRMYIEMGAEVGPCTHSSHTPLHTAVANSSANMVKLLLECGANPNAFADDISDSPTPLCGPSEYAIPTALVNCGPKHEGKCHCWRCCGCASGRTPLHVAAAMGREATIRLLVAGGARIDVPTIHQGDTALHLAAMSGNVAAVQYLIDSGANVQSQNFAGETALQVAVKEHRYSMAKLLQSAACQVTRAPLFDGVSNVEAGIRENNTDTPLWSMQNLSLEDKPRGSSTRKLGEVEVTNSTGGIWVLV